VLLSTDECKGDPLVRQFAGLGQVEHCMRVDANRREFTCNNANTSLYSSANSKEPDMVKSKEWNNSLVMEGGSMECANACTM
jgi:hypothetical protein